MAASIADRDHTQHSAECSDCSLHSVVCCVRSLVIAACIKHCCFVLIGLRRHINVFIGVHLGCSWVCAASVRWSPRVPRKIPHDHGTPRGRWISHACWLRHIFIRRAVRCKGGIFMRRAVRCKGGIFVRLSSCCVVCMLSVMRWSGFRRRAAPNTILDTVSRICGDHKIAAGDLCYGNHITCPQDKNSHRLWLIFTKRANTRRNFARFLAHAKREARRQKQEAIFHRKTCLATDIERDETNLGLLANSYYL